MFKELTRPHFRLLIVVLSAYLAFHFLSLLPYAQELFGAQGLLADHSKNLTGKYWPDVFAMLPPWGAYALVLALGIYSLALPFQRLWPWVPAILGVGWLLLFGANNFIVNPGTALMAWLLFALGLIPRDVANAPRIPQGFYFSLWILLAMGFSFDGLSRLDQLPSLSGANSIEPILQWLFLGLELLSFPLIATALGRKYFWTLMFVLQIVLLSFGRSTDLSAALVIVQLFVFDPAWLRPKRVGKPGDFVLFFDGYCGLCSGLVNFLMTEDQLGQLRFATLQGELGEKLRQQNRIPKAIAGQPFDTLIVLWQDQILEKSDAAILALEMLGGFWRFSAILRIIPKGLRDSIYDLIAKHRYRIFGKTETCRLPTKNEREFFLS